MAVPLSLSQHRTRVPNIGHIQCLPPKEDIDGCGATHGVVQVCLMQQMVGQDHRVVEGLLGLVLEQRVTQHGLGDLQAGAEQL